MDVKIYPSKISGEIKAISSKTMAHRTFITSMLAGRARIKLGAITPDVEVTERAISVLGFAIKIKDGFCDLYPNPDNARYRVDFEDSAPTIKMLIPVLCALGKGGNITGKQKSLKTIEEVFEKLNGCAIYEHRLPTRFSGRLAAGEYILEGNASQLCSGLLMALPLLEKDSTLVIEPEGQAKSFLDMTVKLLGEFGIAIERTATGYFIRGGQSYVAPDLVEVEGDYTNAAYFAVANTFGNDVVVTGLKKDSFQADSNIESLLAEFGKPSPLLNLERNGELAPIFAFAACFKKGDTVINNLPVVKLKETDRIKVLVHSINKLGGSAEEIDGGLIVHGTNGLRGGAIVDSFGDKRIAMAITLAATMAKEPVTVLSAQGVNKVYPNFFNAVISLGGKCSVI